MKQISGHRTRFQYPGPMVEDLKTALRCTFYMAWRATYIALTALPLAINIVNLPQLQPLNSPFAPFVPVFPPSSAARLHYPARAEQCGMAATTHQLGRVFHGGWEGNMDPGTTCKHGGRYFYMYDGRHDHCPPELRGMQTHGQRAIVFNWSRKFLDVELTAKGLRWNADSGVPRYKESPRDPTTTLTLKSPLGYEDEEQSTNEGGGRRMLKRRTGDRR